MSTSNPSENQNPSPMSSPSENPSATVTVQDETEASTIITFDGPIEDYFFTGTELEDLGHEIVSQTVSWSCAV